VYKTVKAMFFLICFGSLFSWIQAPIQAFLRPSLWIPGLRAWHRKKQFWHVSGNTFDNYQKLLTGLQEVEVDLGLLYGFRCVKISKVDKDKKFIQAYFLSPFMQWLDVVELQCLPGEHTASMISAHSFSSGVLPVCIPFTCILNIVLFFFPFYDWGQNKKRLEMIREMSQLDADIEHLSNC